MKRIIRGRVVLGVVLGLVLSTSLLAQSERFVLKPVSSFWLPTNIWSFMVISGGYLCLVGDDGVRDWGGGISPGDTVVLDVLDVSNPATPVAVNWSRRPMNAADRSSCLGVTADPDHLYIAVESYTNATSEPQYSVDVVGMNTPTASRWEKCPDFATKPLSLHWSEDCLCVLTGPPLELHVFDAHSPFNLVKVSTVSFTDPQMDWGVVAASERYAYVVGTLWGVHQAYLQVVDLRKPQQATIVSSLGFPPVGGLVSSMSVTNGHAYIGFGSIFKCYGGVSVIDVSDVNHVMVTGEYGRDGRCVSGVAIFDTYMLLVGHGDDLILDVSDACRVQRVGTRLSNGNGGDYACLVENGIGYILSRSMGLSVVDIVELPAITCYFIANGRLNLQWNEPARGMKLQRTTSLTSADWQDVLGSVNTNVVSLPVWGGSEFFRLAKP